MIAAISKFVLDIFWFAVHVVGGIGLIYAIAFCLSRWETWKKAKEETTRSTRDAELNRLYQEGRYDEYLRRCKKWKIHPAPPPLDPVTASVTDHMSRLAEINRLHREGRYDEMGERLKDWETSKADRFRFHGLGSNAKDEPTDHKRGPL